MTIKYFQAFSTKYDSFPVSACQFKLDMYTRVIKDHKKKHYELVISMNKTERWKLTTLEGFHVEDFKALLRHIGIF